VNEALASYRFDQAAQALYAFVWGQVCDWYVEFAKPLFDGPLADETRATMAFVLDHAMIMLHPMMPFITEDLWAATGTRAKMLVHTDWPDLPDLTDPAADAEMAFVTRLIDDIRSARAQMHVPVGLKIPMLALQMDPAARAAWDRNAALIQRLARIDSLTEAAAAPRGAVTLPLPGATFALPLDGIIDVAAEIDRLEKSLGKLDREIAGLNGRLTNPNFAASAPEDVVDEARANLADRQDEAAKLRAARDRLREMA
jgi:valyl-tRNA synthetase